MNRRSKVVTFWEDVKRRRLTELAAQIDAAELADEEERRGALVVAKNALLALVQEARRTRWIALASLAVAIATLVVVVLR